MIRAALCFAALIAASSCIAGAGSSDVSVNITLATGTVAPPEASGVCVSQTLSEQNGAVVRVVCESGQFVSISPLPGGRFVGSHGGAYSFHFGSSYRAVNVAGFGEFAHGAASAAAFRVYGVTESSGRFDLLVSF